MTPIPYRQHVPSGIKTYTDEMDWRSQHVAGNIPVQPGKMRRCWSDPTKIGSREYLGDLIPGLGELSDDSSSIYTIPAYSYTGAPIRISSMKDQDFYNWGPTLAHNSAIATMRQYSWVYEKLGMLPRLLNVQIPNSKVIEPNFTSGVAPNYPIDIKSDHIYFTMGNELVALPTREFILRFSVKTTDYRSMREAVAKLAADAGITDESFVQLARLALQEKPQTVVA